MCEASYTAREVSLKARLFEVFCSAIGVIPVKISVVGEREEESSLACLSNLLYLISALNQVPESAISVLQSQLHFSIQMA